MRPGRAATSVAHFSKSVSKVLLLSRVVQGPSGVFAAGSSELKVYNNKESALSPPPCIWRDRCGMSISGLGDLS